jgi:acyl-CoA thioester hydrolase
MARNKIERVKIDFPDEFIFSITLQVRLCDLATGLHLANHILISYLNETLTLFLKSNGHPDYEIDGVKFINGDVAIIFKSEALYGDLLKIDLAFGPLSEHCCNAFFYVTNEKSGKVVAEARMAMFFFDFANRKVTNVPEKFKTIVEKAEKFKKAQPVMPELQCPASI